MMMMCVCVCVCLRSYLSVHMNESQVCLPTKVILPRSVAASSSTAAAGALSCATSTTGNSAHGCAPPYGNTAGDVHLREQVRRTHTDTTQHPHNNTDRHRPNMHTQNSYTEQTPQDTKTSHTRHDAPEQQCSAHRVLHGGGAGGDLPLRRQRAQHGDDVATKLFPNAGSAAPAGHNEVVTGGKRP